MVKPNRFTRIVAALFLAALMLSAFSSLSADATGPGGGPNPAEPGDTAITGTQSTEPGTTSAATDLYTAAYLLLVVL